MNEALEKLKTVVRALVVSSPTQMDARALLRDYRDMMGEPLPAASHGYRDPIAFLRERFSDCFLFTGSSTNPILTLIVTEKIKHIDNMVQRQKVPSAMKFKDKRRSVTETKVKTKPVETENLVSKTFHSSRHRNGDATAERNDSSVAAVPSAAQRSGHAGRGRHVDENRRSDQPLPHRSERATRGAGAGAGARSPKHSGETVHSFLQKRKLLQPPHDASASRSHSRSMHALAASPGDQHDPFGGGGGGGGKSAHQQQQLETLREELAELAASRPSGVPCTDIIRLYRERYNREINFTRFGFTSIMSTACALEDGEVLAVRRRGGDWLLVDPRVAPPPTPEPVQRARPAPRARPRRSPVRRGDPDDALPGIDFDADVFPEDCVHFMQSIPPLPLRDVRSGALLEVALGEVYSPSHFWLMRLGQQFHIAMHSMMDEMGKYYNSAEGRDRPLALGAVRVGHYCASLFEGDWHRALIVKVLDAHTVKVRHVDYGTVDRTSVEALRPLRREWAALPAQAVRARLAGVRPPAGGGAWPRAAATHFLRLVHERALVAHVLAVDAQRDLLEVLLLDTAGDDDISIADELVRAGYADPRRDSALMSTESYLCPSFEALENGDTPNYAELHEYLRDGIALEFVDAYRRHVPCPAPPEPAASPPSSTTSSSSTPPSCASADSSRPSDRSSPVPRPTEPPPPQSPAQLTPAPPPPPAQPNPAPPPPAQPNPAPPPPAYLTHAPPPPACFSPAMTPPRFPMGAPPLPPLPPPYFPVGYGVNGYASPFPPGLPAPPMQYYAPSSPQRAVFAPAPTHRAPPPQYNGNGEGGAVTLSASECEVFRVLNRFEPQVAYRYMVDAIERKFSLLASGPAPAPGLAPAPGTPAPAPARALNPEAPPFRLVTTETQTDSSVPVDALIKL